MFIYLRSPNIVDVIREVLQKSSEPAVFVGSPTGVSEGASKAYRTDLFKGPSRVCEYTQGIS